ncbi:MAG: HlyD family efflux transporter periplasmic adaptor subunit [Neisseriaceae bacterium]|nr:MAG: HlyD family efflux transporter periplasmic adaptor subunit [Neisseriaceae bacterium]
MNKENNEEIEKKVSVVFEKQASPTLTGKTETRLNKRMRNLIIFNIILVLVGLFFLFKYLMFWSHEVKTDNSYVNGHIVYVNTQISSTVNKVLVEDTDIVQQGDLLALLDKEDYQLAYDKALNHLKNEVRVFKNLNNSVQQAKLNVDLKRTALAKVKTDYYRRLTLLKSGAISQEELSHLKLQLEQAQEDLHIAQQAHETALNNINDGISIAEQPNIRVAIADLKQAWLNLQRTEVRAPIAGQIAKRNIQIGQKVAVGQNLLLVVSNTNFWVDANFKENQLKRIKEGQSVELESDLYGSDVKFRGNVVGISAGTGSAFSLLPAQNASGNWIKVVQRVPVRIALKQEDLEKHPLKIGLSMKVRVLTDSQNNQNNMGSNISYHGNTDEEIIPIDYQPIESIIQEILVGSN